MVDNKLIFNILRIYIKLVFKTLIINKINYYLHKYLMILIHLGLV